MRFSKRVKRLEAAAPRCDPNVRYLAGPGHVPSDADRCRRCGGSHILVIEEEIVAAGAPVADSEITNEGNT